MGKIPHFPFIIPINPYLLSLFLYIYLSHILIGSLVLYLSVTYPSHLCGSGGVLVKVFLEAFFAENLGVLGGAFCLKNFRWFYPDFYSRIDQFVV